MYIVVITVWLIDVFGWFMRVLVIVVWFGVMFVGGWFGFLVGDALVWIGLFAGYCVLLNSIILYDVIITLC